MGGGLLSLSLSLSLVSQLFLFAVYFFNFLNLFTRFSLLLRQKFTNFTRFYGLLAMTARFVILSLLQKGDQAACKAQGAAKNPHSVFSISLSVFCVDTSLSLSMTKFISITRQVSMTNSGFYPKITDKENALCHLAGTDISTQILKQKFKFFTQNSRHFTNSNHLINSTHFITLSQISSLTQGFFIFLPQIFAQCKLINFNTRRKNGR